MQMTGQLPDMAGAAHGRLTHWNTDTESPVWQAAPPGPSVPEDRSEHVGTGHAIFVPLAVASAAAVGKKLHPRAHPACATSYSIYSKPALFQARPHPRALAAPAELAAVRGVAAFPAIPFVPKRQSRHCWPLEGLLSVWNHARRQPAQHVCCQTVGARHTQKEMHHEADADQRHAA